MTVITRKIPVTKIEFCYSGETNDTIIVYGKEIKNKSIGAKYVKKQTGLNFYEFMVMKIETVERTYKCPIDKFIEVATCIGNESEEF